MGIISQEKHQQIYYFLFLALVFVLPIHERLVSPVASLIGLNWLLELNFREKFRRLKRFKIKRLTLLFGLVYLPYLAGLFYSENFTGWSGADFALEVKLSLLVFPLLISTINPEKIHPQLEHKILKWFIYGCLTSAILILNLAVFHYFQEKSSTVFFYSRLADPFHPSYLSLYYTFSIVILTYWLIVRFPLNSSKWVFTAMLLVFFQFLTIMLSSKAGIIGVFLMYALMIIMLIIRLKKNSLKPLIYMVALTVIYVFMLFVTPPALQRFMVAKSVVENDLEETNTEDSAESTTARLVIWKCSMEVIRDHPFWGVGPGDVKHELLKKYQQKDVTHALNKGLNAHNQFLQTYMATGLPGFLLLISSFLIPAWFAFRKRKPIYLSFIILLIFHNLVESMLERQAGVVFYGFFNALLFYYAFNENTDHEIPSSLK
jgi:O-antigen ligase